MLKLDSKTYELLQKESNAKSTKAYGKWYEFSQALFEKQPLDEMEDFWKLVAFAYSWMPTIPNINTELLEGKKGEQLLEVLKALKKNQAINREELLKTLVPVVNNSLVGTSKVLHFIAPDLVPIIDSRVQRGWRKFFFENHPDKYEVKKLPSPNESMNEKHIEHYLYYWKTLENWKANIQQHISIRDIEICFYKIGKKPEGKKQNTTA